MKYSSIAEAYEKIEATTKRLEMTDYLVEVLKKTPTNIIDKVVYLTQGKLYPDFVGIEIGIAEKLAIRAVAKAAGHRDTQIEKELQTIGDLGETTQKFMEKKTQSTFFSTPLTVQRVYDTLDKIAKAGGSGSVDQKLALLAGLLSDASPSEAKYIVRTVTGSLRLGIADMTVLDALAIAFGGGKETRKPLERAYNISSDLGRVAKIVSEEGMEGINKFKVMTGEPIRPMLAERLGSSEEIIEKLGGKCIAEYKYDGERVQAHKNKDEVILFSRRLENITDQYPDGVKYIREHVKAEQAIVEAEAVAIDPHTKEMKPFQELMHRRRKYGIQEAMKEHPIVLFMFDVLYVDGKDLTQQPYSVRHKYLKNIVEQTDSIKVAESILAEDPEELEKFFGKTVAEGSEGIICKSVNEDSVYQAGARGWLWIKYKRDYRTEMTDTVDLVIVGAIHGRGKRAGTYGTFLLAAYNPDSDVFETVTKVGTGLTDADLEKLPQLLNVHKIKHKHPRVESKIDVDVWFEPAVVIEIRGADLTLSPVHTCAIGIIREGSGVAIRFPRFTGKYRVDKAAEDATTPKEIVEMYRNQHKKIDG
ncbi:MAG: ATP-dependent DNA ligase [Candidatus Bathyarchaeota archaeon]|nr:ATP-dependent DNA ligase [Candidatus Bathyarchaeum tardum]WNZ29420.1 MAG: ATP-dependent DNA ligase [Candidatus Bathyarchaeota archaeon]